MTVNYDEIEKRVKCLSVIMYSLIALTSFGTALAALCIPPDPKNDPGLLGATNNTHSISSSSGSNPGDVQGYVFPMLISVYTGFVGFCNAVLMHNRDIDREALEQSEAQDTVGAATKFFLTVPIPVVFATLCLLEKNGAIPDPLKIVLLLTAANNFGVAGARLLTDCCAAMISFYKSRATGTAAQHSASINNHESQRLLLTDEP